jgi:hypothetical protein
MAPALASELSFLSKNQVPLAASRAMAAFFGGNHRLNASFNLYAIKAAN